MATRFASHLLSGTHASRPAATAVPAGSLYSCTTHGLIYQSDGATWSTYATLGGTETLGATIIDAKGDLIGGTAADTAARLAVGTNAQVLTADSAETTGMKWATPSAGAAGAVTLLSTTTVAGSAAAIDVTGISGSYNDLILVMHVSANVAASDDNIYVHFNNDTANNYFNGWLETLGTGTMASKQGTTFGVRCGKAPGTSGGTAGEGEITVTIPGYATSRKKVALFQSFLAITAAAGNYYSFFGGCLWNSTAAITRVTVDPGASPFTLSIGSQLRIYGRL